MSHYSEQKDAFADINKIITSLRARKCKSVHSGEIVIPITERYAVSVRAVISRIAYLGEVSGSHEIKDGRIYFKYDGD